MANTATAQTALGIKVAGATSVIPYVISIDTTAADLTIRTPAAGSMVGIVGLAYRETSAHNLTIKSGATTLAVIEMVATDNGIFIPIGKGLLAVTAASGALVIQSSVIISSMLMYVVEGSSFQLT